jgi:hypothetical protein
MVNPRSHVTPRSPSLADIFGPQVATPRPLPAPVRLEDRFASADTLAPATASPLPPPPPPPPPPPAAAGDIVVHM